MQTIIGQFTDLSRAQDAIDALLERKYDAADISYVANDVSGGAAVSEARASSARGTAALGLLTGLGAMTIPSIGPLLAAGPLAAGLAGVTADVVGEDDDSLSAALGVPGRAARPYRAALRGGGALVIMGAREAVADNIVAVLRSSGAVAVDLHPRDDRASGA